MWQSILILWQTATNKSMHGKYCILSKQSALFQQEHISTVTESGFTTSGALSERRGKRKRVRVKKSVRTILMFWYGDLRSTPHPAFSFYSGQWTGSQLSVLARCWVTTFSYASDVLDGNICHCTPSHFLFLLLFPLTQPLHLSFPFFPNLLFHLSIPLSIPPSSPV